MITENQWVVRKARATRPRMRMFCFPFAGGGAAVFRNWTAIAPAEIEVCPVQLPGRENRIGEPAFHNMSSLADAATTALRPLLDLPFAFFGHSMGALLAFEIARRLRAIAYDGPAVIMASAARAPQVPRTSITYNLPVPQLLAELRRLEGTPTGVLDHPELVELVLPLIRADFQVVETYRYRHAPPLNCPIVALGGLEDRHVSAEQLEAWGAQTSTEFVRCMLPGGHFYIMESTNVPAAAALHHVAKYASSRINGATR